ncbi:transposase [Paludisphaera borealis]|uniref:transposase n=1 Tax=Paludisphaera borealis TaxID=1387353 RepID=UPI00285284A9|nr:transposase [Paludisphaera borealis]
MTPEPVRIHRRSIRWKGYDYAQAGGYFVTICVQDRACLFGEVVDGAMRANAAGLMVAEAWAALAQRFPRVAPDVFVVMPNHLHGVLFLRDGADRGGDGRDQVRPPVAPSAVGAPLVGARIPDDRITVGDVVGAFKSLTTLEYGRGVKTLGWPRFVDALWQRNYHEHVIRDEVSLERIHDYILDNPRRWAFDRENPGGTPNNDRETPWGY